MNQGGRPIEGGLQNLLWHILTKGHVLWPLQFTSYISNVHEHDYDCDPG